MKHAAALILAAALAAVPTAARERMQADFAEEQITVPLLGKIPVYHPVPVERARGVVLFVSGDGGWKLGVIGMARRIVANAMVIGIPMTTWQKEVEKHPEACWYPAGELEAIAQAVEKIYKFPRYQRPILVGYSSGATVVYGALAQGPAESFAGAVSLGFCPDLEVRRPFCPRGAWKPSYDPKKHLTMLPVRADLPQNSDGSPSWIALQGQVDKVCNATEVGQFLEQIPAARLIPLPKVGHGFGATKNWGEAFDDAVGSFLESGSVWEARQESERSRAPNLAPQELNSRIASLDLPLVVTWPESAADVLVFISGDGGWMELDQEVASKLHDAGVAVIGWSTLRYFWKAQKPETFRADLVRILGVLPEGLRVFVGGYSFGAEVTAVAIAGASPPEGDPLARVAGLVLLAPGRYATFEVSPLDWIFSRSTPSAYPVRAALERSRGLPVLCLEPSSIEGSGCPQAPIPGLVRTRLPGSHHFGGDYAALAERILEFLKETEGR